MNNTLKLIIAIGVSQLAGLIGSIFTISSIPTWYTTLIKPTLNPPSWIFGPVWTLLYTLMGVAAFIIWKKGTTHPAVRKALFIFGIQLVLNALWSIIFFGLQNPGWAFLNIILMWVSIVWTIVVFYNIQKNTIWLLLPYIIWVSFAAYLNYSIWILN